MAGAIARTAGLRRLAWWWLWPLPALAALYVACAGSGATWLVGFSWVATLWPVATVLERIFGTRAGQLAHGTSVLLVALQLVLPAPPTVLQPVYLERYFSAPQERVQHTIQLPLGQREWTALWERLPQPEAYVYVWLKKAEAVRDPALVVSFDDQPVGVLDPTTALPGEPPDTTQLWHRLRVSRDALERGPALRVAISPREARPFGEERVGVQGGFSHRPTAPGAPSAFFDGARWVTEPAALFSNPPHGLAGPLRYYIEVRLVDAESRRLLATYY